jgi:hypothetical protein
VTVGFPHPEMLAFALGGAELLLLFVLIVLPVLLLAAGLAIYLLRRRFGPPSPAAAAAAKLAELQELKSRGLITEDEFKTRRRAVIDEL